MDKTNNLAKNLELIRKSQNESLAEFSERIGIPRSTLQSIMAEGNTTLDTAIRISEALNVPIDTLLNDENMENKLEIVQWVLEGSIWFNALPDDKKMGIKYHMEGLLEVLFSES